MIIFAADREVTIGTIHLTGAFLDRVHGEERTDQPLVVLREATREEWIQCCIDTYGECRYPENPELIHFYEVSTD